MITLSSLTSPAVQCKIAGAMRYAVAASFNPEMFSRVTHGFEVQRKSWGATVYIKNAKGNNFIRCDYRRGEGFVFYGSGMPGTITSTVIQSLRA